MCLTVPSRQRYDLSKCRGRVSTLRHGSAVFRRFPKFSLAALAILVSGLAGAAQETQDAPAFVLHLERVTYRQLLRGLDAPETTLDALARGDMAPAIEAFGAQAAGGDQEANIALVRLQRRCAVLSQATPADAMALDKLRTQLPESRARTVAVAAAQADYNLRAKASCLTARFDLRGIESRLRAAVKQGDLLSATELARFTNDPGRREALLVSAAAKNYAPAQYQLARSRVEGVQRGLSTENVASIRILLKQAGQTLPAAKLDFANCVAVGCDGHPADAPTAAIFGVDAARDGEAASYPAMMRMPWRARLKPEELVAWQYFGDRLNEAGCTGDGYIGGAVQFAQTLAQLEKGLKPDLLAAGKQLAEKYWTDYGERAKREQLCQ